MKKIRYCIVGGGVAGIGFIDGLMRRGETDFVLFEGRDQFAYTLNWMPYVKRTSEQLGLTMTGVEFKRFLAERSRDNANISLSTRLLDVDKRNKVVFVNFDGKRTERVQYDKLVIAVGGVQALYGAYLLPGFRGAGLFTTYQVGEMLTQYDFVPGKRLFVLGNSQYAYETARIAQERGIETIVGATGGFDFRDERIHVHENIELLEVLGEKDRRITGVRFLDRGREVTVDTDALAVDGRFIVEHKMRDLLGLKWDLNGWHARLERGVYLDDDIVLVGDANRPDCDFMHQYEKAFHLAGEF